MDVYDASPQPSYVPHIQQTPVLGIIWNFNISHARCQILDFSLISDWEQLPLCETTDKCDYRGWNLRIIAVPQDCDQCAPSVHSTFHFVNYLTYQSPQSSDVQSGFPIGVWGPQAVLWHLKEAKRWKTVWLLSSSCKYPESPRRAPALIASVPFHSTLFVLLR